jgi:hypothetical protein
MPRQLAARVLGRDIAGGPIGQRIELQAFAINLLKVQIML